METQRCHTDCQKQPISWKKKHQLWGRCCGLDNDAWCKAVMKCALLAMLLSLFVTNKVLSPVLFPKLVKRNAYQEEEGVGVFLRHGGTTVSDEKEQVIPREFASEAESFIAVETLPTKTHAQILLQTGTHSVGSFMEEHDEHVACTELNNAALDFWTYFPSPSLQRSRSSQGQTSNYHRGTYRERKERFEEAIESVSTFNLVCKLYSGREGGSSMTSQDHGDGKLFSFPISSQSTLQLNQTSSIVSGSDKSTRKAALPFPALDSCTDDIGNMLQQKSYIQQTKVVVPWLLFRPSLVHLADVAATYQVSLTLDVVVGDDFTTATSSSESCPRLRAVLESNRLRSDQYKHMFHSLMLSDMSKQLHQLTRLQDDKSVHIRTSVAESHLDSRKDESLSSVLPELLVESIVNVDRVQQHQSGSARPQPKHRIEKTGSSKRPIIVFVAGLEGVGHHMFSDIGRRFSSEKLYSAFTNYVTTTNLASKAAFRRTLDELRREVAGQPLLYLNTVYTTHPVNMYSFPWGGPKCYLKRFARNVCNIDLLDLAALVQDAGFDFRIIVLKRDFISSVISASVNRKFGTVFSQARMVSQSWALLRNQLDFLSQDFFIELNYEELIGKPKESLDALDKFLNLTGLVNDRKEPVYYNQAAKALNSSAKKFSTQLQKDHSLEALRRDMKLTEEEALFLQDELRYYV